MIALIRKLFWFTLFLVFTLAFITLFEHGWTTPGKFVNDARSEVEVMINAVRAPIERKQDPGELPPR